MAPRTPLLRPDRYFAERRLRLARAVGVVALLTIALLASVYALGWVFTARIDGTVMVDNPARPSETFCEDEFFNVSGCDQPREVERNIDSIISPAINRVAGQVVWAIPLAWVFIGVLLHVGSWLANGKGGVSRSFAVAGWGLAPGLVSLVIGVAVLWLTFDPVTVTPGTDPSVMQNQVLGNLDALQQTGSILGIVTGLWGGAIWAFGLYHARNVSGLAATVIAGIVSLGGILLGGG